MKERKVNIRIDEEELRAFSAVADAIEHIAQEDKRRKIKRACKQIRKSFDLIMDESAIYNSDEICEHGRIDFL